MHSVSLFHNSCESSCFHFRFKERDLAINFKTFEFGKRHGNVRCHCSWPWIFAFVRIGPEHVSSHLSVTSSASRLIFGSGCAQSAAHSSNFLLHHLLLQAPIKQMVAPFRRHSRFRGPSFAMLTTKAKMMMHLSWTRAFLITCASLWTRRCVEWRRFTAGRWWSCCHLIILAKSYWLSEARLLRFTWIVSIIIWQSLSNLSAGFVCRLGRSGLSPSVGSLCCRLLTWGAASLAFVDSSASLRFGLAPLPGSDQWLSLIWGQTMRLSGVRNPYQ